MKNPTRIVMRDRLEFFSQEREIDTTSSDKFNTYKKADYRSTIGFKIKKLRTNQGKTLEEIRAYINTKLKKDIPLATLYSWAKGSQPREAANEVDAVLDEMIAEHEAITGGAWCSGEEVRSRMLALNKELSVKEMSDFTGVPKTTLFSWLTGFTKTKRKRFEEFEKSIHASISSNHLKNL